MIKGQTQHYDDKSGNFTIAAPVGIQDTESPKLLDLYPNPVQTGGLLNISFSDPNDELSSIVLLDLTGKVVKTFRMEFWSANHEIPIDLADLRSGYYQAVLLGKQGGILEYKAFLLLDK